MWNEITVRQGLRKFLTRGISLVEMLVAVSILLMIIVSIVYFLRSGANEEIHLDARARAFQNYSSLRTHLRQDVLEAVKIEVLNEKTVKLYMLEVDEDFNESRKEVLWSTEETKKVVRIEADKKKIFDFSDSISSNEMIRLKFVIDQ